jgi:hypothetical protein
VVTPPHLYSSIPTGGVGVNNPLYVEEMVKASEKAISEAVKNTISPDLQVRSMVLEGNSADQIVDLAESEKVDMDIYSNLLLYGVVPVHLRVRGGKSGEAGRLSRVHGAGSARRSKRGKGATYPGPVPVITMAFVGHMLATSLHFRWSPRGITLQMTVAFLLPS